MEHIECTNVATGIKINPFDGVRIYDRRQHNSLCEWDRRVAMLQAQQVLRELKDLAYLVNFIRKHDKQEQLFIAKCALTDPNLARGIMIAPSWNDDWTPAEKAALKREMIGYLIMSGANLKPGTLYLVRNDTGLYNFGGSTDIVSRLHRLNISTPGGISVVWKSNVLSCQMRVEDAAQHLAGYRICGHWYKLGAEQVEWFIGCAREWAEEVETAKKIA